MPMRVIDLGLAEDRRPTLYVSHGTTGRYIALSHCWGKDQTYSTKQETFSEKCLGMDHDTLPKTFRDAIQVTRDLGIRYLWIDSLCIVQDDWADWEAESAAMSEIYANAYLTIAASLSLSDECGFLGPRKNYMAEILKVDLHGKTADVYFREQVPHDDSELSASNRLFTRAWAFQELLVSRRVVLFSSAEVQWHCKSASWCECDRWRDLSPSLNNSTLRERRQYLQHTGSRTYRPRFYKRWYKIVEAYSALNLTIGSDPLPALSALAQQFQAASNDTYLAGLWKGDLLRGLAWQSSWDPPSIGTCPKTYLAPSWCWSSITGKVFFGAPSNHEKSRDSYRGDDEYERLVLLGSKEVQCTISGMNPFGEVRDGFLTLSRRFTSAILEVPEVVERADEGSIPYRIWPESGSKNATDIPWSPSDGACFRPDVPLIQSQYTNGHSVVANTVERSMLNPGQRREAISARVWVIGLDKGYSLVLCRSRKVLGAYERIGILTDDSYFWNSVTDSGATTRIMIV